MAITGKDADLYIGGAQVCDVQSYSWNPKSSNHEYASNCTGGFKKRVAGTRDVTGSVEGLWDPGRPIYGNGASQIQEGSEVTIRMYLDDWQYIDQPAIVDEFKLDVDIDEGEFIKWSFSYSGNGSYTISLAEESSASSNSSSSSSGHSSSSSSS